jgi:tetratricopeptide (TPR) repeat protein
MRRLSLGVFIAATLISIWLTSCSKKAGSPAQDKVPVVADVSSSQSIASGTQAGQAMVPPGVTADALNLAVASPELSPQQKYDAILLEALNQVAEKKYTDALVSLGTARALQDSDQVRGEIDRVKTLVAQQLSAEQTAQDIKTVLDDGKTEDAARLATTGLQQFGATDAADQLANLKRQADALTATQIEDNKARFDRFRRDGDSAVAEKNLRAAAIAFEQALQYGQDAALQQQLDEIHATLARYDDCRRRAADLRRDPANLEDALAALQEAASAWDTLQVRQEIDLYTLALQKRRDRLSVADFDIRGDIGLSGIGRTLAEEILPQFKRRFDLVERGELGKVMEELRLEGGELFENEGGRRELGRLAKLRYLVLGSVTPLGGITLSARLVDVRTGLVVQTAKVVAPAPEALLPLLPQLANVLMMTDEQKIAYENQLALQTSVIVRPVEIVPLPPPPEALVVGQPLPPPILVNTSCPPDLGGLRPADFEAAPAFAAQLVVEREEDVQRRVLQVAVSLGDNLFRRGRYREAQKHFELALHISPHEVDLRVRLDRCRTAPPATIATPPPPPVIVVAPRPRVAVLNFVVNADPALAPPGFGNWAADQMSAYFAPTYEVADRGELFWYMGRLGLTVRDVAVDVSARRWLGRALNVRYFAFGIVQQTASFNVTTHLVDAETGEKQGLGSVHVQDHQELKLRMAELVHQTQANPAEQERLQREARENEQQLNQARQLLKNGQFKQAIAACQEGLKRNSTNMALQAVLQQAEQQERAAELELARRHEAEQRQAQAAALQRQQLALKQQAEAARRQAEQEAAKRGEAARRTQELERQRAHDQLVAQGKNALQKQNYPEAVRLLESAMALKPSEAVKQELSQAKTLAESSARAKEAEARAKQEAEIRRQREAELARARAQVEEQRRRREAEDLARRKLEEQQRLARELALKNEQARQAADRARINREADQQATRAQQAQAEQKRKADAARPALPPSPARMPARPPLPPAPKAGAPAPSPLAAYTKQMQTGTAMEKQQKWDEAVAAYKEALRLMPGDIKASLALHLASGQKAMKAKQFAEAAKEFEAALKLSPNNADAAKGLRQARQGRP